ncbi:MAG: RNA polymerase factor sigma-54 [Rhizobiales bacterium]|nr:RNA polymerase factor sigma-54 [Hyphomicrobiales bacterium]
MALAAKLQLRQSQSLVMTPQLMQSIRLLQLSHVDLERFVEEEIERNPLLERAERDEEAIAPAAETAREETGEVWVEDDSAWTSASMADTMDASLENVFPDDPGRGEQLSPALAAQWKSAAGHAGGAEFDVDMEDVAAAPVTLADVVAEQIAFQVTDPAMRLVAAELAGSLDPAGYLGADPAEIAARLGLGEADIERVLSICQTFEPHGIFARNLAECLALQLAARDRLDPAMRALLANLELLARRDFPALRRICGVDDEDLVDMVAEIRALDPRPGLAFGGARIESIVPDVEVRPASDGTWTVELNPDALPRVLLNNSYVARLDGLSRRADEKEFLSECLQNANWLTRSLDQRARTILKVASEIVRQQDAFLNEGVRHLRPLTLKTVADAISMHESTVSRVTANKFMLTPRGVFELRYFFNAAIASVAGEEAHSSEAVRDRIRGLIAAEDAGNVLSDDAIVDVLRKDGVNVARRTVAKYREGMDIPSSVQRRREKRMAAVR